MGENDFAPNTVAVYGITLLLSGVSFTILQKIAEKHSHDLESLQKAFINLNKKGVISTIGYIASIPLAYINPLLSEFLFLAIAIVWLVPEKTIENALKEKEK
jgi:uncharacterized membrane protein